MDTVTIIGVSGAVSILWAFLMSQTGRWSTVSFQYDAVNAVGAGLLILYSYLIASYPFLVLNLVWFLSAAYDLVKTK